MPCFTQALFELKTLNKEAEFSERPYTPNIELKIGLQLPVGHWVVGVENVEEPFTGWKSNRKTYNIYWQKLKSCEKVYHEGNIKKSVSK